MIQEGIKEYYNKHQIKILELQGKIEVRRQKIKNNQRRCDHPNAYAYTACGHSGRTCPDCGWDQ